MDVTPSPITSDVIWLLYLFHGTLSEVNQLTILPVPEIVSLPPFSSHFAFVPHEPDSAHAPVAAVISSASSTHFM